MNKIYTFIFLQFIGFCAFSQSLELTYNDEVVSDSEVDYTGSLSNDIKLIFNITNNSESSIGIKVKRRIIEDIEGTFHTFCLSECYPPTVSESTNTFIIEAGQTTGADDFYIEFSPQGNEGNSVVQYEISNVDDKDDVVSVTVNFNITLTGITSTSNTITLDAYPNPAIGETININYDFISAPNNAKLIVHNILGVEMEVLNLQQSSGRVILDINSLPKGVYLYSIENIGKRITTKRFIVK
ncbi:MAG: T9SS type A sorting domain-containing protein [Bacteroidales bacterium]